MTMEENIELKLIGITYNQIESGVYALVLEDVIMGRRLAIVIGYPEAQSIECRLQNVKTPRPLSHDLMAAILQNLGATLLRVDIHRIPGGPYAGKLTIENVFGDVCQIDSRSSDAIALAIRVGAPIYTNSKLLEKEGYTVNDAKHKSLSPKREKTATPYARLHSISQLKELLVKLVNEEKYEEAENVKKEIEKRTKIEEKDDNDE